MAGLTLTQFQTIYPHLYPVVIELLMSEEHDICPDTDKIIEPIDYEVSFDTDPRDETGKGVEAIKVETWFVDGSISLSYIMLPDPDKEGQYLKRIPRKAPKEDV